MLQILVAFGEQVERDEHRRGLGGETLHARGGGVDALTERLPIEALCARFAGRDDDLAIEQAGSGEDLRQSLDELGEVTGERLRAARADLERLAVPGDETAEAVPLRLEQHPAARLRRVGNGCCGFREHRNRDLVAHASIFAVGASPRKSAHRRLVWCSQPDVRS